MQYRTFEIDGVSFMVIGSTEAELNEKEAKTRATVASTPVPDFSAFDNIDFDNL